MHRTCCRLPGIGADCAHDCARGEPTSKQFLESVVTENERALEIARVRYDVGQVDLLSVLQMQARVLGARASLIRIRDERLAQRVNLHLALGGSFELGSEFER